MRNNAFTFADFQFLSKPFVDKVTLAAWLREASRAFLSPGMFIEIASACIPVKYDIMKEQIKLLEEEYDVRLTMTTWV